MKKPPLPKLVNIAILTTITIIFWVFFSVYQIFNKTEHVVVPEEIMSSINPVLDVETLNQLPDRIYVEEGQ